eukprot:TRINITY_DN101353_c0_g1_i1.p1 TRINITY_DN101353_c0_g1~~TRINITY_DN101353_c0_g1_i1.p1  ORF type:complete len:667 (-),score=142.37 TRINITY_DN101353_c0_g1_i1:290-2290(-)
MLHAGQSADSGPPKPDGFPGEAGWRLKLQLVLEEERRDMVEWLERKHADIVAVLCPPCPPCPPGGKPVAGSLQGFRLSIESNPSKVISGKEGAGSFSPAAVPAASRASLPAALPGQMSCQESSLQPPGANFRSENSSGPVIADLYDNNGMRTSPTHSLQGCRVPSLEVTPPAVERDSTLLPRPSEKSVVPQTSATLPVPERKELRSHSMMSTLSIVGTRSSQNKKFIARVEPEPGVKASALHKVVMGTSFEVFVAVLIFVNTMIYCAEVQFLGLDIGYEIQFGNVPRSGAAVWPSNRYVFAVLEWVFGLIFLMELFLKIFCVRLDFFKTTSGWFDFVVVAVWVATRFSDAQNMTWLRVGRLVRLLRLVRLIRVLQELDVLFLLIGALRASIHVLVWSLIVLLLIMMCMALCFNLSFEPYITSDTVDHRSREVMYKYFGTFSRAFLSVFEITLGNWVVIVRVINEEVSEFWAPILMIYRFVVGFAVMAVITSVFLHETLKVAQADDDIMILQKERAIKRHIKKMQRLFHDADESGDGFLSLEEFTNALGDRRIQMWLAAMDLEIRDVHSAFKLVDMDMDGRITAEELVRGVAKLKGNARSLDMLAMLDKLGAVEKRLEQLGDNLGFGDEEAASGKVSFVFGNERRPTAAGTKRKPLERLLPTVAGFR